MKRAICHSAFCILAFVLGLAAPSPFRLTLQRTANVDAIGIQGVWTDIAWERYQGGYIDPHWGTGGGSQSPPTYKISKDRIEFEQDRYVHRFFYLLNPDGVAGTIDWTPLNEAGERIEDRWSKGCYLIKDDLLIFWMGEPGGPRQEKFVWSASSAFGFTILRRGTPTR